MTPEFALGLCIIVTAIVCYLWGYSAGSQRDLPVKRINERLNETSTPEAKAYIDSLWDVKR